MIVDYILKIEAEDQAILSSGKPDFIAINYYSTATIAASKNDGSDVSARAGINRSCWEKKVSTGQLKILM